MLLLHWGSYRWAHNLWVLIIYLLFLLVMPEVPGLATDSSVRVFPGVWKLLSFLRLSSWDRSPSLPLCLSFYLLYFFLPPFEDNGLLFWVPDDLCQHSEVVYGIYSAFNCSFDEFVGKKVVSLSYSSAILGPPPPVCFLTLLLLRLLVFFLLIVRHWLGSRHSSPSGSLL